MQSIGSPGNEQVTSIRLALFQPFSNGLFFGFILNSIHHRNPGPWLRNRPFTKQLAWFSFSRRSTPQAAAFPVLRTFTQIGPQRISFNASLHHNTLANPTSQNNELRPNSVRHQAFCIEHRSGFGQRSERRRSTAQLRLNILQFTGLLKSSE